MKVMGFGGSSLGDREPQGKLARPFNTIDRRFINISRNHQIGLEPDLFEQRKPSGTRTRERKPGRTAAWSGSHLNR
jgi:hypothetical protein